MECWTLESLKRFIIVGNFKGGEGPVSEVDRASKTDLRGREQPSMLSETY
jgi:hypothetical protein